MKAKYESTFDEYFPEESAEYYSLLLQYAKLTEEDHVNALWIAQKALILADRYNTIGNDATKLDNCKHGIKTDRQKFFYGRYRILREIHTHSRVLWRAGEEDSKTYGGGAM
ncbi:MAG: hypothetical protein GX660_22375 [Clostridiaceae bacterium]|jgi:hypothetical protein|nr:hypothetical protein [Clostridiaceae bacterium]